MKFAGHISLIADLPVGQKPRCPCGDAANRFARCRTCHGVVASCGSHKMTIDQERDAHCPKGTPVDASTASSKPSAR